MSFDGSCRLHTPVIHTIESELARGKHYIQVNHLQLCGSSLPCQSTVYSLFTKHSILLDNPRTHRPTTDPHTALSLSTSQQTSWLCHDVGLGNNNFIKTWWFSGSIAIGEGNVSWFSWVTVNDMALLKTCRITYNYIIYIYRLWPKYSWISMMLQMYSGTAQNHSQI